MIKRIWIPGVISIVLAGLLIYMFFLRAGPDKKITIDKTLKSFQSMLSPVRI